MNLPATRTPLLRLDVFSQRCGIHPDLIRRFVVLGLVEPEVRRNDTFWFSPVQVRRLERMLRLRSDLGLNYNALALVIDLLERIEELERNPPLRPAPRRTPHEGHR